MKNLRVFGVERFLHSFLLLAAWGAAGFACTGDSKAPPTDGAASPGADDGPAPGPNDGPAPVPADGPASVGVPVSVGSAPNASAYAATKAAVEADAPQDEASFVSRWRPKYLAKLPYDPATATNLPIIQGSSMQLGAAELDILSKSGLVVSARQSFGTFFMGYTSLYANDLPLFVSGDSVLHAVHRSYDAILQDLERAALGPSLNKVLAGMRTALAQEKAAGGWPAETLVDVDEFLAVALSLLAGTPQAPVAGGDQAAISAVTALGMAGQGVQAVQLFGDSRAVDFSQLTPRGHYVGTSLESYFRAMMWLGRTDLRLLSQSASGVVSFHRRQFAAAALMAKLVQPVKDEWTLIDRTLRSFVGESDNMTPTDFSSLMQSLDVASWPALLTKTDDELAGALVAGGYGIQRIASQLLFVQPGNEGAPLDRAFLLLGQRFVIDSQVFSNLVFDRLRAPGSGGATKRMMPNPLDVAFAALANAGAAELLSADLERYAGFPQALHAARAMVDAHEPSYWTESLYTAWLGALRAASPASATTAGAQPLLATEAWSRRILQMQLASWAELRHDTILYAKQSYTGIPVCEFPDAYVEPIPALWRAIADFGHRGAALVSELGGNASLQSAATYFTSLANTATMLESMALAQEQDVPFTAEQMAFINQAVEHKLESVGCASIRRPTGWYPKLFYQPDAADDQDTLIADVHTQPADESGAMVGKILHVATGFPRLMVVSFQTCSGPRVYAGIVSAYHETITTGFERLTDQKWTEAINGAAPAEVAWMAPYVSR